MAVGSARRRYSLSEIAARLRLVLGDNRAMDRLARPSSALIASGDPWRMTLRLPVFGTLVLAAVFFLVTAPVKEAPSLFDHAPWLNDPFDTVISFMILLVPLIAVLCVPRLLLCRRSEPLPATRIRDLLRG
ncbi:MAG: hypothetical protein WAK71_06100, partial [Streptosporangiaceae bacterium]